MALIKLINDFINEEYKYSGNEVVEAFKKAVKRELFLDGKRIDPSTFGQHLSVNVVGQVLTAYKEFKRGESARPQYLGLPEVQKKPITPIQAWELVERWSKEEGQPTDYAPYNLAFEHLLQMGKVQPVEKTKSNRFGDNRKSPKYDAVVKYIKQHVLR